MVENTIKVKTEIEDEHDYLPLKQRFKLLLASKLDEPSRQTTPPKCNSPPSNVVVKTEEDARTLEGVFLSDAGVYKVGEKKGQILLEQSCICRIPYNDAAGPMNENQVDSGIVQLKSQLASCHSLPGDSKGQEAQENNAVCSTYIANPEVLVVAGLEKMDTDTHNPSQHPSLSTFPVEKELENTENLPSPYREDTHVSCLAVDKACHVKNKNHGEIGADALDHIPLKKRRKMLLLTHCPTMSQSMETSRDMHKEGLMKGFFTSDTDFCNIGERKEERVSCEPCSTVRITETQADSVKFQVCSEVSTSCYGPLLRHCSKEESCANSVICSSQITNPEARDVVGQGKIDDTVGHNASQHPTLTMCPIKVKVEHSEVLVNPYREAGHAVAEACDVKNECHNGIGTDALDHITLQERRRILLLTQSSSVRQLRTTSREVYMAGIMEVDSVSQSAEFGYSMARSSSRILPKPSACKLLRSTNSGPSSRNVAGSFCVVPDSLSKVTDIQDTVSPTPTDTCEDQFDGSRDSIQDHSLVWQESVSANADNVVSSAMPPFLLKEEIETEENGLERPHENALPILSNINNVVAVKTELEISAESCDNDEVDHMSLHQRKKVLIARNASSMDIPRNLKCFRKTLPALECNLTTAKPEGINCRRKRKKTATDSAVTALEEDAPGLLEVLIDKGILTDEIKLYGNEETEDPLDISWEEESFLDLENVVSKLFPPASSFLKFPLQGCTKGSKPSYCLACLLSLVEQARYLQFRKWRVEWGWCRDLKSFIFVFERHNRIVLEHPEYGFATYFFELVHSLPTSWQIKRLVTAMKRTNCSRANLIENKSLLVGEDLSEGEAKVLEDYGWIPNTGLASMLNYCDRVFHDRKNEKEVSEWRSKIGKILMDGHDGGRLVLANLPKKLIGYNHTRNSEVRFARFDMKPASSPGETRVSSDY